MTPLGSTRRKHVETREADTVKHYKQHYADKETKLRRFVRRPFMGQKTPRHCIHRVARRFIVKAVLLNFEGAETT